jgi:hypothetical protein
VPHRAPRARPRRRPHPKRTCRGGTARAVIADERTRPSPGQPAVERQSGPGRLTAVRRAWGDLRCPMRTVPGGRARISGVRAGTGKSDSRPDHASRTGDRNRRRSDLRTSRGDSRTQTYDRHAPAGATPRSDHVAWTGRYRDRDLRADRGDPRPGRVVQATTATRQQRPSPRSSQFPAGHAVRRPATTATRQEPPPQERSPRRLRRALGGGR